MNQIGFRNLFLNTPDQYTYPCRRRFAGKMKSAYELSDIKQGFGIAAAKDKHKMLFIAAAPRMTSLPTLI